MIAAVLIAAGVAGSPCWITTPGRPDLPFFSLCSRAELASGFILIPADPDGLFPERRWKVEPADVEKVIRDGGDRRRRSEKQ